MKRLAIGRGKQIVSILLATIFVFTLLGNGLVPFAEASSFDDCESLNGWSTGTGSNLSLDSTDKKEGSSSIQTVGSELVLLQKRFEPAINSQLSVDDGFLNLWLYISDVSKLDSSMDTQIELSSAGYAPNDGHDSNEFHWSVAPSELVNGWNELSLALNDAELAGTVDLSQIDWFRVYYFTTDSVTMKIDGLSFETIQNISEEIILDNADAAVAWTTSAPNVISLDLSDKKEGEASLKSTGGSIVRFQKSFSIPIDLHTDEPVGRVSFWLYVDDSSKLTGTNQIEISSSGHEDTEEYGWAFPSLNSGWNHIQLNLSDAQTTGGIPDLHNINWFRIYYESVGNVIMKIDDIRFIPPEEANPEGDCLQLTVSNDNTHGAKYYYNKFSSQQYTFQSGDYIEYDVYLFNDTDGAGGIDVVTTDGSCMRDCDGSVWQDQNSIGGHPCTKISGHAMEKWYHRKLAVPAGMVGKTSAYWAVAGEADYLCGEYTALYDNITVTGSGGEVKEVLFQNEEDITLNEKDLSLHADAVMQCSGIEGNLPVPYSEPTPQIVTPINSQDDLVVADYVVTDDPYNADNTGHSDATEAIQKAIDDCAKTGGGTVWMPAGEYKVTGTIAVKAFVTLRGDWKDPDTANGNDYGTVILADVLESNLDYPALFRIGGSAGCRGLTVYYPNQSATNPVPYPYTFEIPGGAWDNDARNYMLQTIQDITLINAYKGISASFTPNDHGGEGVSAQQHEQHHIENVKGTVLNTGMRLQNESESGVVQNVKFDNSYWANATTYNPPLIAEIDAYTQENGTAFCFGDLEWERIVGIECSDYQTGIRIDDGPRIQFCGQVYGAQILNCNIAVKINQIDTRWGISFLQSTLQGNIGANPCCIQKNVEGGYVTLTDCNLTGNNTGTGITIENPGTSPATYPWKNDIPKPTNNNFYNVLETPYCADNTGVSDATEAIQQALTDAGNAGGGTVYLPAGHYKISTHLTVPANVNLRGSSSVPVREQISCSGGTVLYAYEGKNTLTPDTDTAFITLNGANAGVSGLRVWYPEHDPRSGIYPYPYTIRGNGAGVYVMNVGFTNSYNGIDFKTYDCSNHMIKNLSACVFKNGIVIGSLSTEGWIENCLENGTNCIRTGYENWPNENYVFDPVINYTKENLTWITIDNAKNEHLLNDFTYGAKVFMEVTGPETIVIYNSAADGFGAGIQAQNSSNVIAANFMKYGGSVYTGNVAFYNLQAIGM